MVSLRWMRGASPFFCPFFSDCGAWPAFEGDFSGGLLVHRVSVDKVARAVPPLGPFGFFLVRWPGLRRPPSGPRYLISGVPAA